MIINYLTAGSRDFASSRLRAYLPGDEIAKYGHTVTFNGGIETPADIFVFQKRFNERDQALMRQCHARGIKVVLDVDDMMNDIPFSLADVLTTDTKYKQEFWPNAVVVPDVCDIESGAIRKSVHTENLTKVVWVGNAENAYHLRDCASACHFLRIELTVITDLNNRAYSNFAYTDGVQGVAWDVKTVDAEMIKADVAVFPLVFDGPYAHRREWIESKSENKIVKAWALGLPVIGTPIPSYLAAGLRNSASTHDGWVEALERFRPRGTRIADAKAGAKTAKTYAVEKIALKWMDVFEGLLK